MAFSSNGRADGASAPAGRRARERSAGHVAGVAVGGHHHLCWECLIRRDFLPLVREELDGRFQVDREIARGGAARVFLATNASGHPVALKVLHPALAVSVAADRFLQEIAILTRLDHPHIAKLLDWGETDRVVYYAMAFVDGPTLRDHIDAVTHCTLADTRRIGRDLLDALQYAHGEGIVHRDVKPDNIVLSGRGAVLLDFGIARAIARAGTDRLTRSGFCVGTSAYMSPEQVQAFEDIDERTDLYSLGCVLFECLAGTPPFTAQREDVVLRQHIEGNVPDIRSVRDEVDERLSRTLAKALATDREARWRSAREMLAELRPEAR